MPTPLGIKFSLHSVLRVVEEFLLQHNLVASARALELETAVRVPEVNDDIAFCRDLILDARWAEAEDLLAPLARARGFDHSGVLFSLRRQRFLELLASRLRGSGDNLNASALNATSVGGPSPVLAVVAALRDVESVCESRVAFNSLCYCLTLPAVNDHPDFSDWTPHLGRLRAYASIRLELLKVFPATTDSAATRTVPMGQLENLLCQAAAAQAATRLATDPRLLAQLPMTQALVFDPLRAGSDGVYFDVSSSIVPTQGAAADGVLLVGGRARFDHRRAPASITALGGPAAEFNGSLGGTVALSGAVIRLSAATPIVTPLSHAIPVPPLSRGFGVVEGEGGEGYAGASSALDVSDALMKTIGEIGRSKSPFLSRMGGGVHGRTCRATAAALRRLRRRRVQRRRRCCLVKKRFLELRRPYSMGRTCPL